MNISSNLNQLTKSNQTIRNDWDVIPKEIYGEFFSFLDVQSACNFILTCKTFCRIGTSQSQPWKHILLNDVQFRHFKKDIEDCLKNPLLNWRTTLIKQRSNVLFNILNYLDDMVPGSSMDTKSTISQPLMSRIEQIIIKPKNCFDESFQSRNWVYVIAAIIVIASSIMILKDSHDLYISEHPKLSYKYGYFETMYKCINSIGTNTYLHMRHKYIGNPYPGPHDPYGHSLYSDEEVHFAFSECPRIYNTFFGVPFLGLVPAIMLAQPLKQLVGICHYYIQRESASYSLLRLCKYTHLAIKQKVTDYVKDDYSEFSKKSQCSIL